MTQPISADEGALVENLMRILSKAFSAVQLYGPNNQIYLQAIDSMRGAFTLLWQQLDELQFEVSETTLTWEGNVVLKQDDKSDSIPWTLYKDGVRSLTMSPSIEDREILAFLHTIKDVRMLAAEDPDDLLTMLWDQDFQHLRYRFIELGYDNVPRIDADALVSGGGGAVASSEDPQQRLESEGKASDAPAGIVEVDDFDSTLYFLDDHEVDYLNSEIDREYRQNLRTNVLKILFEIFQVQNDPAVRGEILSIIDGFVPHLLAIGDFHSVTLIVQQLRQMHESADELSADHRKILAMIPVKIANPTALGQLIQSLDDAAVQPTQDETSELFRELGPQVLDTILVWMPKLANARVCEVLRVVSRGIAEQHPAQAVNALRAQDVAALLQAIEILATLKVERLAKEFGRLTGHADVEVRRRAVDALGAIGSAAAMKQLEAAVEDEDRDVRVAAVQFCVQHQYPGILSKVEAAVKSRLLRGSDLAQKKPFFEAYGLFAGNAGVDPLYGMLNGRRVFKRKDDPETRACAAMALGKIGTPKAREALEKAVRIKDSLVKNAVGNALREFGS
ncbi:MAG: HEAT repeat domain-containing protein [Gemmatimonadetes bacterium]|nr:HEAT repeat domain-containing protein [Gemmatimonadota bacterium]